MPWKEEDTLFWSTLEITRFPQGLCKLHVISISSLKQVQIPFQKYSWSHLNWVDLGYYIKILLLLNFTSNTGISYFSWTQPSHLTFNLKLLSFCYRIKVISYLAVESIHVNPLLPLIKTKWLWFPLIRFSFVLVIHIWGLLAQEHGRKEEAWAWVGPSQVGRRMAASQVGRRMAAAAEAGFHA